MNRKTILLGALAAGASSAALATPVIPEDSVSISENASHVITVSYTLGDETNTEGAIVTVDFQTNATGTAEGPWVSIGERNFRNVNGWVNKFVPPGKRTLTWRPTRTWPDRVISGGNFRAKLTAWAKTCPPDYLAINLSAKVRSYYTSTNAMPFDIAGDECRGNILLMRKIPAANVTWRMGSPVSENGRNVKNVNYETPHYVTLTKDYYIGVFPVTAWQYYYLQDVGNLPKVTEPYRAMWGMSWNKVRYGSHSQGTGADGGTWPTDKTLQSGSVMDNLRKATGINSFDLPTTAQWEFACRAGTQSALYNGKELTSANPGDAASEEPNLNDLAYYAFNTAGVAPTRVGMKQPNPWGIYDLYGSVFEWCLDYVRTTWEANETDPEGPETGTNRFQVGGVYNDKPAFCRSAFRMERSPVDNYESHYIFGFRVVCDALVEP